MLDVRSAACAARRAGLSPWLHVFPSIFFERRGTTGDLF
jgi:hypothetical protein